MTYIYGLICPISGDVRYIGKSINPEVRHRAHINAALRFDYNHHTARWIRKLAASGMSPVLRILEEVPADKDWRDVERAWIQLARDRSWPITNSTSGGEGLDYINPEDQAAFRENMRKAMRRFAATPAGKLLTAKRVAASLLPEARIKKALSLRRAYKNPDVKRRLREAMDRVRAEPDYKDKLSAGHKKSWDRDRSVFMAAFSKPTCKEKQSERKKKAWKDPEVRERMKNRWTPEARAKQSAAIKARHAKIQAAMTPEVRAKQGAAMKAIWAKRRAAKSC